MSVQVKGSGTIGGLDEGLVVSGIVTSSTQINVGSNIKIGSAGIVTATSFVGSGANLTSLPSQATIANNADNRIITGGSGVNLNGEANLTFDGSNLGINGDLVGSNNTTLYSTNGGSGVRAGLSLSGSDQSIKFYTVNGGTERLRITSAGEVVINDTAAVASALFGIKVNPSTHNGIGFKPTSNGSFGALRTLNAAGSEVCNIQYDTTNANINFRTSNSQKLRIDSSGNTHFGSSGTLNDSNTVSIIPSDGRISFGMDGRTSYVTGETACYIYSGEGSSGTTLAGELILQSRSNVNRNITFVTGATPTVQMIVYGSGGVFAHTKNNFLLNEVRRGDTSSQHGPLSTSWSTDTTISDTISNYQRGQRIIIRCTVPCGIALGNSSGTNYGGTNVRIKVTGNTSGGTTYSNNRPVWYRADGAGTHETTINLFICVYINESNTTFSNGETLTVNIEGQKNGGGTGTGTHYLGGWSTVKEITIERYIKEL